jgi:hypothetical protein
MSDSWAKPDMASSLADVRFWTHLGYRLQRWGRLFALSHSLPRRKVLDFGMTCS